MHVLHNFFLGGGFNKQNSFLLGPLQPSSPTTKELHEYDFNVRLTFINEFLPPGPGRNGSESGGKRKNDEESETRRRGGNGRKTREGERKKRKLNGREWRLPGTNNIKLFPGTKLTLDFGALIRTVGSKQQIFGQNLNGKLDNLSYSSAPKKLVHAFLGISSLKSPVLIG